MCGPRTWRARGPAGGGAGKGAGDGAVPVRDADRRGVFRRLARERGRDAADLALRDVPPGAPRGHRGAPLNRRSFLALFGAAAAGLLVGDYNPDRLTWLAPAADAAGAP